MTKVSRSNGQLGYEYSRLRLYFSTIAACTLYTGAGAVLYWSSPALPLLKSRNYTSFQNSMLSALPGLAPGPLITIFGIDSIGRKNSLFLIWLTMMAGWIILSITDNIHIMMAARFIGGWGMGAAFSAIGIFNSEISDAAVRGSLNSLSTVFVSLGSLTEYCVGPFVTYKAITLVSGGITIGFGIFYWFLPESPYFYIAKGKIKQARSTLYWLRKDAPEENIEEELSQIMNTINQEKESKVSFRKAITSKAVLKQLAVAWFILYFQILTGNGIFAAYAQTIFQFAKFNFNGAYVPIFLSVYSIFVGLQTPFLVQKFGNKSLFLFAGIGSSISHLILAIYFFLLEGSQEVSSIAFLPILGAFCLMTSINLGLGGLVWAVVSDLFSPSIKGFATGICGIFSTFLGFIFTAAFGIAKDVFGFGPVFLGFSILLFTSTFGFCFIPNITRMTLEEIQDYFGNKSVAVKKQEAPLLNLRKLSQYSIDA